MYGRLAADIMTLEVLESTTQESDELTKTWYVDHDKCGPYLYVTLNGRNWYLSSVTDYSKVEEDYKQYVKLSPNQEDAVPLDLKTDAFGVATADNLRFSEDTLTYGKPEHKNAEVVGV